MNIEFKIIFAANNTDKFFITKNVHLVGSSAKNNEIIEGEKQHVENRARMKSAEARDRKRVFRGKQSANVNERKKVELMRYSILHTRTGTQKSTDSKEIHENDTSRDTLKGIRIRMEI